MKTLLITGSLLLAMLLSACGITQDPPQAAVSEGGEATDGRSLGEEAVWRKL